MTHHTAETALPVYARVAGLTYVLVIVLGIVSAGILVESNIIKGDDVATVSNIKAHELQFRIGILGELLMYALVVVLSLALYVLLRTVNRNLALLALLWRLGEAITGAVITVLGGLIPLLLLSGDARMEPGQVQSLVGLFLDVRTIGLDVVLIFVGLGGTLFCYLFYRSRYVPRILAAWGMVTYLSMLVLAITSMLQPDLPETVKMIFYAPGALFEILFGLWLLIKGVNLSGSGVQTGKGRMGFHHSIF
jgi:hypothetical protein